MDVVSAGQKEWQKDHQQKPRYLQAQTGHQLDVCHHKNIQNRCAHRCWSKPSKGLSFAGKLAELEIQLSYSSV